MYFEDLLVIKGTGRYYVSQSRTEEAVSWARCARNAMVASSAKCLPTSWVVVSITLDHNSLGECSAPNKPWMVAKVTILLSVLQQLMPHVRPQ